MLFFKRGYRFYNGDPKNIDYKKTSFPCQSKDVFLFLILVYRGVSILN